eukprot:11724899-Alexandrium_andersonii.AAC.1
MCGGERPISRPPEEGANLVLSQAQGGPSRRPLLACRIGQQHNWGFKEAMHICVANSGVLSQVLDRLGCAQDREGANVTRQGLPRRRGSLPLYQERE